MDRFLGPLVGLAVGMALFVFSVPFISKVSLGIVTKPPCKEEYFRITTINGTRWNCDEAIGYSTLDLYGCTDPTSLVPERKQIKKHFTNVNGVSAEKAERDCGQKKSN